MVSDTSRNGGAVMIGLRRRTMGNIGSGYPTDAIMTVESNPEVLAVCYAQGWCKNAEYMTAREAAKVTSIRTAFKNSAITHFDEFQYFTKVTSVAYQAFYGRSSLVSIVIPDSVVSIDAWSFYNCSNLTKINIPSGVTSIGEAAFNNCQKISSDIIIPNGVSKLQWATFNNCKSIKHITLGSGLTNMNYDAIFANMTSLLTITCLPATAPTIKSSIFQNVKSNGTLYVPIGSTGYETWMGTGNYYLGKYNWTKVEQ